MRNYDTFIGVVFASTYLFNPLYLRRAHFYSADAGVCPGVKLLKQKLMATHIAWHVKSVLIQNECIGHIGIWQTTPQQCFGDDRKIY